MAELLRTRGLTKHFRGLVANDAIDFGLERGEVRCIIGPNGAGKTTFISLISGHQAATAGEVWFKGQDVTGLPVATRARMGIVRKFQTPSVFDSLTVYENLELAVIGTTRPRRTHRHRVREVLDLVRLTEVAGEPAVSLSHGQRQWLETGMLLANDAELLLLDEPTAGMTAEETHATGELIRTLATSLALSTIIIEHDVKFIRDLEAPVTVFHLGRILVEGPFGEIARNEEVRNVYLGNQ